MATQKEAQYQKIIVKSVTTRHWELFDRVLDKNAQSLNHSFESKCCKDCSRKHTILHFALQYNASFYIVQKIVKRNPKIVFESDCKGQ